ncbi:MAG: hypothetical protein ABSF65_05800 [Candidatus Bathyarchaeia archaeon]|jgi:hypothetical protein
MSYNGQGGSGYGNQRRRGSGFFGRGKKRDEKAPEWTDSKADSNEPGSEEQRIEPQPLGDYINWSSRPLEVGTKIVLCTPTTLTQNSSKFLLSNDLAAQNQLAYQIGLLGEKQPLELETFKPNGQCRKYKIVKIADLKSDDRQASLEDMSVIGNLRNSLKRNGFTVIPKG